MKEHLFLSSFWLILRVIWADYQFELQLLKYQNPSHRLAATERCCDSDLGLIHCRDHCDNTFLLCLSPPGQANCSLGQVSTGTLYVPDPNKSDFVDFSNGGSYIASGVQNPLVFTGHNWPGGFELVVIVGDEDVDGGEEVVDKLRLSRPFVRPGTRFSSAVEIRGNGGRGFLRLNYRLTCRGNYTGDTCSLCSTGHCTEPDVCAVARPCKNEGVCTLASHTEAGYLCSCPPQFGGSRCEVETTPHTTGTTPPHPAPTTSLIVGGPSADADSSKQQGTMVAVTVVAGSVLLILCGVVLLLLSIILLLLRRRRQKTQTDNFGPVTCKHNISEEGMYDNPTYMWSKPVDPAQRGGDTAPQQRNSRAGGGNQQPDGGVGGGNQQPDGGAGGGNQQPDGGAGGGNQQPDGGAGGGNQQPAVQDKGEGQDDVPYHKVINPLYCLSLNPDLTFKLPVSNLDYDPCYATPSFSHSHVDMEHKLKDSKDTCSDIYEPIEK